MWSDEEFDFLFELFQSMSYAKFPDNRTVLCRFYDPRCLEDFLLLHHNKGTDLTKQLELVKTWAVWNDKGYKYINNTLTIGEFA